MARNASRRACSRRWLTCHCHGGGGRGRATPSYRAMRKLAVEPRRRFAIEVQPRYRDVLPDRWPVALMPEPDELLSSYLHRIALANGLPPRRFGDYLGFGAGLWSAR